VLYLVRLAILFRRDVQMTDNPTKYDGRGAPLFSWLGKKTKRGTRGPFKMPGGKYYLAPIFANMKLVPRTRVRVSPYGGAAAELFCWEPAAITVYNDADPIKWATFKALQDEPESVWERLNNTPCNEAEFAQAKIIMQVLESRVKESGAAGLEGLPLSGVAVAKIVSSRMSVNGLGKDFAWSERLRGGQPEQLNSWDTFRAKEFPRIVEKCRAWLLLNLDGCEATRVVVETHAQAGDSVFAYYDPTYLKTTRVAKEMYGAWEMTPDQHLALLDTIVWAAGRGALIAISGYDSEMYRTRLEAGHGWQRHEIDIASQMAVGETKKRKTEIVWTSFHVDGEATP
jgi:site-specific DNA-adenine methylase